MLMVKEEGWACIALCFANPEAILGKLECVLVFEAWLNKETFLHAVPLDAQM
jgi:hypothetical protein